jgi:HEPN domain-containing protein
VQARHEVAYRLALAEGFLTEATQDMKLERWRSCVDNAQLVVENSGKAVLALFGITPKTHDPAREIAAILRTQDLSDTIQQELRRMLPDLLALGTAEHFLTDYGDEATYTLPWDLFTKESAEEALAAASRTLQAAQNSVAAIQTWPKEQDNDNQ